MASAHPTAIRLVVHSSRDAARRALIAHLSNQPDFAVVGHTTEVRGMRALCSLYRPDCALVDVEALTLPVVEAAARLQAGFPDTEFVVRYVDAAPAVVAAADRAGLMAVQPCTRGLAGLTDLIRQRTRTPDRNVAVRRALTDRELAVLALMGAGRSVPEMAQLLQISRHTVENHKRSIYAKFGVGNQSHAVSRAISLGLFDVGEVMVGIDGLDRLSDAADPPGADQSGESGESGWGLEPAPRPRPGLGRVEYERGRPALAVLCGPAGPAIDQVMLTLIRAGLPFVRIHGAVPVAQEHWARWHRGPLTAVLVDPAMEDWTLPDRLDIPAVVVQSTPPDGRLAVAALQRGAYALVWLADVVEDLCPVLSLVAHGYRALSAAYVGELSDWMSSMLTGASASPEAPELTARERDILFSIARGHTVRQTAHALGISAKTVENTQARLFRKLGTRNRSETLTAAYRLGLVDAAPMP